MKRKPTALTPLPPDRWLEPGTLTFTVFFPELAEQRATGVIDDRSGRALMDQKIRRIVAPIARKHGRGDRETVENLLHDLKIRVARMDAATRYDPAKGRPLTYLRAIASTLGHEQFHRRQPPRMVPLDSIPEPGNEEDPGRLAEANELREELAALLDRMTPGEVRALVREFGPLFGHSCPQGRARKPTDPDALDRAFQILAVFRARQTGQ